eukprot:gene12694-13996_t
MESGSYIMEDSFKKGSFNISAQEDAFDMTEGEALLGSVFQSCDSNNDGAVRVSKLLDYLLKELSALNSTEILSYLDDLAVILDATGKDPLISRDMYQQGVHQWIENIQSKSSFQEEEKQFANLREEDHDGVTIANGIVYRGHGQSEENKHACATPNGYNDSMSMERSFLCTESSNEWEKSQTEILGRIEELQITNKKLNEDNGKLQAMVYHAEEANTSLTTEIDSMKKKIKKYEHLIEKSRAEEVEFETLKTTVNEYQLTKDELLTKASQLERENQALQRAVEKYQKAEISKIALQQSLEEENRYLLQQLNDQKQLYAELEVLQDLKQKMVDESSSKSEHLSSFIAEMSKANEALKAERNKLQVDLLESRHEISKLTALASPSHTHMRQPIHASTPFQKNAPTSLQQELNAELAPASISVSPKSHLSLQSTNKSLESAGGDSDTSIATASSSDKYSTVAQQIKRDSEKIKGMALKHIADLADMNIDDETSQQNKVMIQNWEDNLNAFTERIQGLAVAKKLADKRSGKVLDVLKKVTVIYHFPLVTENQVLTESRGIVLKKMDDISNSSFEMGERVDELVNDIVKEKAATKELKAANEKLLNCLKQEKEKNSVLCEQIEMGKGSDTFKPVKTIQETSNEPESQMNQLTTLVLDLEARVRDYTRKLFDLEEDVEKKDAIISMQSKEIQQVQQSFRDMNKQHKEDLKHILGLFSNGGYMAENEDIEDLSVKTVKKRFYEYVAKMQSRIKNMGVRDGPVGSEGPHSAEHAVERSQETASHQNDGVITTYNELRNAESQTETVSSVSVYCETDLQMHEIENALNTVAVLREIHDDRISLNDCGSSQSISDAEQGSRAQFCSENVEISHATGVAGDSDFQQDLNNDGIAGINSNCDFQSVDHLEEEEECKASDEEFGDVETCLILDSETTNCRSLKEEKSKSRTLKSKTKPKSSVRSRRFRCRSESISTDDSISFDEDAMESDDSVDAEPRESESTAESETSTASTSSKRARRIGISAEPVRLPTWSELRESFKLNQQILLEEEIQSRESPNESVTESEQVGLMKTNDGDQEDSSSLDVMQDVDGNANLVEISCDESANLKVDGTTTEQSLEWCYEVEKSKEDSDDIPADLLKHPTKKRSVSFRMPEDEILKDNDGSHSDGSTKLSDQINKSHSPPPLSLSPPPQAESQEALDAIHQLGSSADDDEKADATRPDNFDSDKDGHKVGQKFGVYFMKRDSLSKFRSLADKQEFQSVRKLTDTDKDLEKQFTNAVLAFRTDQYTLQKRLENQERARDVAESGMEREIRKLIDSIKVAEHACVALEQKETVENLYAHADILRKTGMKVSAQAEQHGCFQQESRAAKMIEIFINYAENLRLCIERAKEVEDNRSKDIIPSLPAMKFGDPDDPAGVKNRMSKYCEKCNGRLTSSDKNSDVKTGFLTEDQLEEKSIENAASFAPVAPELRQRRKTKDNEIGEPTENELKYKETFIADSKTINYAADVEKHIQGSTTHAMPRRGLCSFLQTILRFFLSLAILSAILFMVANYVEIDLRLLSRNWNDKFIMYGKKFFNQGKKNAI